MKPTHSYVQRLVPPIGFRIASGLLSLVTVLSLHPFQGLFPLQNPLLLANESIPSSVSTSGMFLALHFYSKTFLLSLGPINLFRSSLNSSSYTKSSQPLQSSTLFDSCVNTILSMGYLKLVYLACLGMLMENKQKAFTFVSHRSCYLLLYPLTN